ncbi:MAG: hypothetical protein ACK5HE_05265 [Bacteroidota bacterium]|jgi:hypothetical protein
MKNKIFTFLLLIAVAFSVNSAMAQDNKAQEEITMKVGNYDVRYSMKGRTITNKPRVDIMTEEHGTVVVDVTIDKYGHVISAVPGAKGTTTESKYLMTKAKQCAETALYDTKPTYPLKTQGTFTITF